MKTGFFIFLISVQIIIISLLSHQIYKKQKNILGETAVNPIKKNLIFPKEGELKYFYEPKPNIKYNWHGTFYYINSDGLHELKDYSVEKPKDTFRIITLGDSFTFGLLVSDEENWPAVLEKIVNSNIICTPTKKIEVINLGVEGYDFEYEIARFNKRGKKYNPDLVILMNVDFLRIRELMGKENEKIWPTITLLPTPNDDRYKYFYWRLVFQSYLNKYPKDEIINYQTTLLKKFINENQLPILFVDVQNKEEFNQIFSSLADNQRVFFKEIIYTKEMKLPDDGHPSPFGHKIIAQEILAFLLKNHLIPCQ